ncbi:MAG: hypothetical protein ACO3SE_08905, partial [Sedimenticolaceae bacterium]
RYDVVSLFIRSDVEFSTTNRQSIGGTKPSLTSGAGWTLYTRETGFGFYADGAFTEIGTRPQMLANTWYNVVYVLDWYASRNTLPRVSIWVDGALVADNVTTTHAYTELRDGTEQNFYLANSTSAQSSGNRWIDLVQVAQVNTLPWGMSDATIANPSQILADLTRSVEVGDSLVYDGQGWVPSSVFGTLPTISLQDLADVAIEGSADEKRLLIDHLDSIRFLSNNVPTGDVWAVYANSFYGVAIGEYTPGDNTIGTRLFCDPSAGTILESGRNKKHWLMGAFGSTTEQPELRWTSGNPGTTSPTGNSIGLKLPAGITEDTTYTFPPTDGNTGQVLSTDGAGQLSWADSAGLSQIQQAADFALNISVAGTVYQYDSVNFASNSSGYDQAGEVVIFFGGGGERVVFNGTDSLGQTSISTAANVAVAANGGSTATVPVWLSMDEGAWTSHVCTMASTSYSYGGPFLQQLTPEAPTSGSSLRVTFTNPNPTEIPLADGDLLAWNAVASKFKPVKQGSTVKVQELADFAPQRTEGDGYAYTWSALVDGIPDAGQGRATSNGWELTLSTIDNGANNAEADLFLLEGGDLLTLVIGGVEYTDTILSAGNKNSGRITLDLGTTHADAIATLAGGDSFAVRSTQFQNAPGQQDLPVGSGQFLQYSQAKQAWEPVDALSLEDLKVIVGAATDFAEFQSFIAML